MLELQNAIMVNKYSEPINMDFRNAVKCFAIQDRKDIDNEMKAILQLRLIFQEFDTKEFQERLKSDIGAYCEALTEWIMPRAKRAPEIAKERTFDWLEDWELVCAAFMQCYNMDLLAEEFRCHWQKFLALFSGLHDCRLTEIMSIRAIDLTEIKDKKSRTEWAKRKRACALGQETESAAAVDPLREMKKKKLRNSIKKWMA